MIRDQTWPSAEYCSIGIDLAKTVRRCTQARSEASDQDRRHWSLYGTDLHSDQTSVSLHVGTFITDPSRVRGPEGEGPYGAPKRLRMHLVPEWQADCPA